MTTPAVAQLMASDADEFRYHHPLAIVVEGG